MNRSANSVALRPFGSVPHSAAQLRVLNAALALFAEHGVGGTSIRRIADALGVTKAAIYFHFKTKDEIVLSAARLGFAKLEWALEAAEADESPSRAREFLIRQVIENSLEQRHVTRALQHDPVMLRLLTAHEPFQRMFERMQRVMIGEARSPGAWMQVAMLSGAIAAATTHPLVADVEDDTVRSSLMELARFVLARLDGNTQEPGGPTMARIKVEEDFAAKAAAVWEKLADFGGIDRWMPGVKSCESTGNGVGAERTFSVGPAKITERLEKIDPAARTLTYSIVRGPMPVKNCLGTISVSETGAESCRVEWSASFDLPDGVAEEQVAPALKGGYRGALRALKTQIES